MNGKGSKRRPTDQKKFDRNYERIFGNKESKVANPHNAHASTKRK